MPIEIEKCFHNVRNNDTARNCIVMKVLLISSATFSVNKYSVYINTLLLSINLIITIFLSFGISLFISSMNNPVIHHNILINGQLLKRCRCQHLMDRRQLSYLHIHVQFAHNDVNTNYDCPHTLVYINTLGFCNCLHIST